MRSPPMTASSLQCSPGARLVAQLRVTLQAIATSTTPRATRPGPSDFPVFDALPGPEPFLLPPSRRLRRQRERCTSADALQKYRHCAGHRTPWQEVLGAGASSARRSCAHVREWRRIHAACLLAQVYHQQQRDKARRTRRPCALACKWIRLLFDVGRSTRRMMNPSLSKRSNAPCTTPA